MSAVAPPPVESSARNSATRSGRDIDRLVADRIAEAARALWWAELTRAVLKLVIAAIAAMIAWLVVDQWLYSPSATVRFLLLAGLAGGAGWYVVGQVLPLLGHSIRPEYAARAVERDFPELRQALLSYVSLRDQPQANRLNRQVVRSIGAAAASQLRDRDDVPTEASGTLRWWLATAAALAVLAGYAVLSPKNSLRSAARLAAPMAAIDPATRVAISDVQPGDAAAVAGRATIVSARVTGLRQEEPVVVRWGERSHRQAILELDTQSLRHVGEIALEHADHGVVPYKITAGDAVAGPFELRVQDVPVVALQSIHYQPPQYTGLSPWTSSVGAIAALDGTQVTIRATVNCPVEQAKIEFNPRPLGESIQATAGATEMNVDAAGTGLSVSFALRSAHGRSAAVELENYRMVVEDKAGAGNPDPIVYPIAVTTDLAPEVAIVLPAKSPKDLPIDAQQIIEVHAADPDFGLRRIWLEMRSGIDEIGQPVLWENRQGAPGNQIAEYRLRPRELGLRIGDTVAVSAVASDNRGLSDDPSVEPNQTRTDPVRLRIVAGAPPPPADDPDADGLSAPDDRPPSDQAEQGGQSEGDGQPGGAGSQQRRTQEDQSGGQPAGGQSGQGDQRDGDNPSEQSDSSAGNDPTGATDPSRQGDQPMESTPTSSPDDSAGQQQSSADEASQGGQPGKAATEGAGDGDDAQAEPGESAGSDPSAQATPKQPDDGRRSNGSKPANNPGERPSDRAQPPTEGEPGNGQQPGAENSSPLGDPSQAGDELSPSGQQQGGESQSDGRKRSERPAQDDSGESKGTGQGENRADSEQAADSSAASPDRDASDRSQQSTSSESSADRDADASSDDAAAPQESPDRQPGQGKSAGEDAAGDDANHQPPEHDGDAFERIRQHIEQQRQQSGGESPSQSPDAPADPSEVADPSDPQPSEQSNQTPADPQSGNGGSGESLGGDSVLPPAEANEDYTRRATDMVLDYLDQTRDQPDRELLEKLNWTEADLQEFRDRWQQIRQLPNPSDPTSDQELSEALRSLGLRPQSGTTESNIGESADSLRSLRDTGTRRPPPAAYRDAFDRFRRAAGRQPVP